MPGAGWPRRGLGRGSRFSPRTGYAYGVPERLSFDRVATIYDETRGLPARALSRVLGVLVDELRGKRVLEVGVGTGRFAVPLQKSGIQVVGIDISPAMVERGLAKGLKNVIFADAVRLPFPSKAFDVATTNHVLHLISEWRDVLREIARVTTESYFSIIGRSDGPELNREYHTLVEKQGFHWEPPGVHERKLTEILKPDLVIPVGPFTETASADRAIAEIARRDYTTQWEVPETLHREAVRALREQWGGKELRWSVTQEITFWRVERLAGLSTAPVQRP